MKRFLFLLLIATSFSLQTLHAQPNQTTVQSFSAHKPEKIMTAQSSPAQSEQNMTAKTTGAQVDPRLEFFCELLVKLDPAMIVGETSAGTRRIIPIIGGSVEGPAIKGEILKGGADWQVLRKDGVTELEAHYQFRTQDGVIIYIKNTGLRVATPEVAAKLARGEKVDPSQYYFRAVPKFEAPINSPYGWINNSIFVCTGERTPDAVKIRVYKLL